MELIDGKAISETIKTEIASEVRDMIGRGFRTPHLAAILVGDDPASHTYISGKEKACREVGFLSSVYKFSSSVPEKELRNTISFLNDDREVDGFIIQLPLPAGINVDNLINLIDPSKDVDGFHPENIGRMVTGQLSYLPATPMGILELIKRSNIETAGRHCVVIGRSNIVGTPLSILLSRKSDPGNCTVTLCHSQTRELAGICRSADIIVAALGQPRFLTEDMVSEGAVVIDVGIHRVPSSETKSGYRLCGDVDFQKVSPKCSFITPVPGGVGPMTITSLLLNTLKAARGEIFPGMPL